MVKVALQNNQDPKRISIPKIFRWPDQAILDLLNFNLENNDFIFDGDWYVQIFGTAMSERFAPNYANIFMAKWESDALAKCDKKVLYL